MKIMHCADVHLDAPFRLSNPAEAEKRRTEQRATFTSMILYAKTHGCDVLLIAGDLFDDDYVTKDTIQLLFREFSSLSDCDIFISPGNHDPYHAKSPYHLFRWPENVHIFKQETLETVLLPDKGVSVSGYAFTSQGLDHNPFASYRRADPSVLTIVCGHGDVGAPLSRYCPIQKADIAATGCDYIALGHIHACSGIQQEGQTFYAYSGCLEGRGFDETGEKGAIYGQAVAGDVQLKGVRFGKRVYRIQTVDLTGVAQPEQAYRMAAEQCSGYGEETALRIVLTGSVAPELSLSADRMRAAVKRPAILEVKDQTQPLFDAAALTKDRTLTGAFYQKLAPVLESGQPAEREIALLALKYGFNALNGWEIGADC